MDFITRFSYDNQPSNVSSIFKDSKKSSIYLKSKEFLKSFVIFNPITSIVKKILRFFSTTNELYISNNGITIKYPDENNPDIPIDLILSKITKPYDAVITLFWQDMLTSETLLWIYNKLHCPILIYSPDMSPMTGGCFYFGNCRNFQNGCGNCPGFNSGTANDQSRLNFSKKKHNYQNMRCAFLGNTWMNLFAKQSNLFSEIVKAEILINPREFLPISKTVAKNKFGLIDKFILMVRSDSHPRKGNKDIISAIKIFFSFLSESEIENCRILVIGDNYLSTISRSIKSSIINLGTVDKEKLIECYQASDCFINASHDDAGPSMINQSIMCGTPVVCYDNGAAIDVIENGKSGYKVATKDVTGLAHGILKIYNLKKKECSELSKTTRQVALDHNSPDAISEVLIKTIQKLSLK